MKQSLSVKELTFLVIIRELLKLIDPKKIKSNFFVAEAKQLLSSYSNSLPKLPSKSTKEITSFFA